MKVKPIVISLLFLALLTSIFACNSQPTPTQPLSTPTATITPTRILPTVQITTEKVPDPSLIAQAYLIAWQSEDYPAMYALLSQISREAITESDFTTRYRDVAATAALDHWEATILAFLVNPETAQVSYLVNFHSVLVGDFARETMMELTLEGGDWRVKWDDGLILPELKGGNLLRMDYLVPARANIYDRNGHALVAQSDAVSIGLNTGLVTLDEQGRLLQLLQEVTGIRSETIRPELENYRDYGWYLPIADLSADQIAPYLNRLSAYSSVVLQSFRSRYYFGVDANTAGVPRFPGSIAPHLTGYVTVITAEEVEKYRRLGYNPYSDRVGQGGLEQWGEEYLAGVRGGKLYVTAPDGATLNIIAETSPQPASAIYTTLDRDLQAHAQAALRGFRGSIVVMERDTGRVLAMASSPGFNPNIFEPTNINGGYLIAELFDGDSTPLLNRSTQGLYPLGSVFKIITMAAGLQTGVFTPESTLTCGYFFTELPGVTLNDWTYDHYLEDGRTQPSGDLTLPEGLMRSCNPWFWHIGLSLYNQGYTNAVADMARGFGLGQFTDVELYELAGNIPSPNSPLDATNQAIGQGDTQVTPLQVADFIAAVGNGGTLYTPRVIEKIVPPSGEPTYVFTPTIRGTLPISDTYLAVIQEAMVSVVTTQGGTARHRFLGLGIDVAGKTGTAQSGGVRPHAWFAGYSFENNPNKPDIAAVVILEYAGEGSDYAAPIFRRMMEVYFRGKAETVFPWEAGIYILKTPTPEPTEPSSTIIDPTATNTP